MLDDRPHGIIGHVLLNASNDYTFGLVDLGVSPGASAKIQVVAGVDPADGFNQFFRIAGEILQKMQVLAQRIHRDPFAFAHRFQEPRQLQALAPFQVEGRVELIDHHYGRDADRFAAAVQSVGNRSGRQGRNGRNNGRPAGVVVNFTKHRYLLLLEFAGRVGSGVIEVALIILAIVEREIVFGQSCYRAVLVANDNIDFDQACLGTKDRLLLRGRATGDEK